MGCRARPPRSGPAACGGSAGQPQYARQLVALHVVVAALHDRVNVGPAGRSLDVLGQPVDDDAAGRLVGPAVVLCGDPQGCAVLEDGVAYREFEGADGGCGAGEGLDDHGRLLIRCLTDRDNDTRIRQRVNMRATRNQPRPDRHQPAAFSITPTGTRHSTSCASPNSRSDPSSATQRTDDPCRSRSTWTSSSTYRPAAAAVDGHSGTPSGASSARIDTSSVMGSIGSLLMPSPTCGAWRDAGRDRRGPRTTARRRTGQPRTR